MSFPDVFSKEVSDGLIARIDTLTPASQRLWGKMDVSKMLAHCSVMYEMIYEADKHPRPNPFMRLVLRYLVRGVVTSGKPIRKNSPTVPQFVMTTDKDFADEKDRLVSFIKKTQELGVSEFDGKPSFSFGALNSTQWSNMLYKHLDHHLQQFGA